MSKKDVHIVYRKEKNDWAAKKEGNKRASAVASTKEEIERLGAEIAKKEKSELIIHNMDGKISDSDSYGNDPSSIKDEKH